jgi:hypothetical protein
MLPPDTSCNPSVRFGRCKCHMEQFQSQLKPGFNIVTGFQDVTLKFLS